MQPLYVILGATASGKGSLGREIAGRIGGQIVSVDSMKVYRRMDIGTAKPAADQRARIGHHCIDIVEPSEGFSVAQFVQQADSAIARIRAGGSIPLAVGGTSLYLKALTEGLFDGPSADLQIRRQLQEQIDRRGAPALHAELAQVDPVSAGRIHPNDAKRIVRALEVFRSGGVPISELQHQWESQRRYSCVMIGLRRDRADQNHRINTRVKRMVEAGLVEEVRGLLAEPKPLSRQAAQAVGYAEIIEHLQGALPLDKAIENIKINTRRLARKQRTWHRRFADVRWVDLAPDDTAQGVADDLLARIAFE